MKHSIIISVMLNRERKDEMPARTTGRTGLITKVDKKINARPPFSIGEGNEG